MPMPSTPEEWRKALMDMFKQPLSPEDFTPAELEIRSKYPGVPHPLYYNWSRSDDNAPLDTEYQEALSVAAESLDRAAQVCRNLLHKTEPMTPADLDRAFNLLSEASFRTDAQIEELRFKYPLPVHRRRKRATANERLKNFIPKLLQCTEDRIIIWTPPLPNYTATSSSIVYTELCDLLLETEFPQFVKWHCDFFHVFRPDQILGARDVDNYPYKPIIDALTRALFTRDCGVHFSCSMFNLESENLDAGCYIRISKREEKADFF